MARGDTVSMHILNIHYQHAIQQKLQDISNINTFYPIRPNPIAAARSNNPIYQIKWVPQIWWFKTSFVPSNLPFLLVISWRFWSDRPKHHIRPGYKRFWAIPISQLYPVSGPTVGQPNPIFNVELLQATRSFSIPHPFLSPTFKPTYLRTWGRGFSHWYPSLIGKIVVSPLHHHNCWLYLVVSHYISIASVAFKMLIPFYLHWYPISIILYWHVISYMSAALKKIHIFHPATDGRPLRTSSAVPAWFVRCAPTLASTALRWWRRSLWRRAWWCPRRPERSCADGAQCLPPAAKRALQQPRQQRTCAWDLWGTWL